MSNLPVISDSVLSAVTSDEWAKTTGKALDAGAKLGGYADRVFGRMPQNAVGLILGDWLEERRIRRWAEMRAETLEILRKRGVGEPFAEVSPALLKPLLEAATEEIAPELKRLWNQLLANAMDPKRGHIRKAFIETLKQFEPVDALVMDRLTTSPSMAGDLVIIENLSNQLQLEHDAYVVSLEHLKQMNCVEGFYGNHGTPTPMASAPRLKLTAYGRELMRACRS